MMFNERDIEFLYEIGSLRNVERGWRQHVGMRVATTLEHTIRVAWIALIVGRKEGVKDERKLILMALAHDAAETRTSDLSYVQKVYVKPQDRQAENDLFDGTSIADIDREILKEYEERQSLEAKIVKDADNLDIQFELKELAERGSKVAMKWLRNHRVTIRGKLYTQSARDLWDSLESADVDAWHQKMNKWLKDPKAGK